MKARNQLPPVELLRQCFVYEEATGVLFWKKRPVEHFANAGEWKRWNKRYASTRALNSCDGDGYKKGNINGVRFRAHRVVWKLLTGNEPPAELDHEDRNTANNRPKNIREATFSQNRQNRSGWGASGIKGVRRIGVRWQARIYKDGNCLWLGAFPSKTEAANAYTQAATKLYGEFARC